MIHNAAAYALASFAWLLELLLPTRCAACGASGSIVCDDCVCALVPVAGPVCACCGAPTVWPVPRCRECAGRRLAFASARAAVVYRDPARSVVHAWKERGLRPIAHLAADLVVEHVTRPAADVISYIPPDGDRSLRRGHQPAKALAHELGRRWQLQPVSLLRRTRRVERQASLPRSERGRNVRGAFAPAREVPRTVVLIDDVYTTGATVAAAASALRAGGADRVDVVTFARAVR